MTETLYYYSILRYVPRPQRGEFVNFGVVVISQTGDEVAVEFTDDWRRARALGRPDDVLLLTRLAKSWKRQFRTPGELGKLFPDSSFDVVWLTNLHEETANLIQVTEPRKALASGVTELVREVFDGFVGGRKKAAPRHIKTKRGLQLAFEAELRRSGLVGAYERNFMAEGAEVRDWTFDYALKNGRPLHFVQTMNLKLEDVKAVLSEATYVAYAKRDLQASEHFAGVPVSVIAEPPDEMGSEIVTEAETILAHDEVPLIMRERVPEFVGRLEVLAPPPSVSR